MTYATQDQLVARYGATLLVDLTDRAAVATGAIDGALVAAALTAADARIDGYLQGQYALPLAVVPPILSDLACAIAIWRLHTGVPGDKIKADYEEATRVLEQIGRGIVKLAVAGTLAAPASTAAARVTDRERVMTSETMRGWI